MLWTGSLSWSAPVKPLADVVTKYTRYDRHQKISENFHGPTSSLLPDWTGQGITVIIPKSDSLRKRRSRRI